MAETEVEQSKVSEPLSRHHYDFGQVVLREVCSFNPLAFFQVLASPDRGTFLEQLWKVACERCDGTGAAWFSPADVGIDSVLLENYPVLLVTMPTPRVMTEVYYVAIVLLTPMDQLVAGNVPQQPAFSYYTLELGISPQDSCYTMLCAWEDGKHLNFGSGPDPEPTAFLQAVAEKLRSS